MRSTRQSRGTGFKYATAGISYIPSKKQTKRKDGDPLISKLKKDMLMSFEEFVSSDKYKNIIEDRTRDTYNKTVECSNKIKELCETMPRVFARPEFTKTRRYMDKLYSLFNELEELTEEIQKIKVLVYTEIVEKVVSK